MLRPKTWAWPTDHPWGGWENPTQDLTPLFSFDSDGASVNLPTEYEIFEQDGIKAMLPKIVEGMSLINNILELRDFKSLPRSVDNAIRSINSIKGAIKNYGSLLNKRKTLRSILRSTTTSAADSYLQMQFNILPLFSDLNNTYVTLGSLDQQVEKLLDEAGKPRNVHYARPFTEGYQRSEQTSDLFAYSNGIGKFQSVRKVSYPGHPMFRSHLRHCYFLDNYQRANARLLAAADLLGVGGFRPSVLWNAIPWSFVVDWVIGVNQWIKRNLDKAAMEPTCYITGYSSSFKAKRQITLRHTMSQDSWAVPTTWVDDGQQLEEVYYRSPKLPDLYNSIRTSGLNLKESSLAVALGITHRRH
jgi:hypothetical protein